jgi:multiple antibiotic resistance protein
MNLTNVLLLWKFFALAFSALLPLVNPLGSALLIVGFVGPVPMHLYQFLARRIAIYVLFFFGIIELIGSAILNFFGVSLPIMQVSGGLVIAAMGWGLLNQKSTSSSTDEQKSQVEPDDIKAISTSLSERSFYPFTFPLTVGPGCLVVTLTLSAKATQDNLSSTMFAHSGILLASIVMSLIIYVTYANAPRINKVVSPSTAHGILRVIAFFLFCIGVQITWAGLSVLLTHFLHH